MTSYTFFGQVIGNRSATTPKLASWDVHEQSFVGGRVLDMKEEKLASF